jgi:hypothetical protein
MSTIKINNRSISGDFSGRSVSVINNKIYVDGKLVPQGDDERNITISIEGNVEELQVDMCDKLEIKGNVGSVKTTSGDVDCGSVSGSVRTMSGDVDCGDIAGSVSTMSGAVKCKSKK